MARKTCLPGSCLPPPASSLSAPLLPPPQVVLSRMQLALHATRRTPHGALCLVLAMSAWSAKTRRASPRRCTDVRVYGHVAVAMHEMSISPPPSHQSTLTPPPTSRVILSLFRPPPAWSRTAAIPIEDCSVDGTGLSPGGQEETCLRSAIMKYLRGNLEVRHFYDEVTRGVGSKDIEAAVLKVARAIPEDEAS